MIKTLSVIVIIIWMDSDNYVSHKNSSRLKYAPSGRGIAYFTVLDFLKNNILEMGENQ